MKKKSIFLGLALATVAVVSLSSCKFFDQKKTNTTTTTPTTVPTTTGSDPVTTGTAPVTTTGTDPVTTGTAPVTTTGTDPITTTGTDPITTTGTDPITSTEVTPTTTGEDPIVPEIDVLTPEEEDDFEGYLQIKSVSDFLSFRDDAEASVNQKAILLCDIDLEGYVLDVAKVQNYTGIFNGRGHAIKNASLTVTDGKSGLLFKSVSGGTVTNVRFVGCNVDGGNLQGVGVVTGLAGGNSKFTQIEFNACSVKGGNYVGLVSGEFNEVANTYGAAAPIIVSEITAKNNSSTTGVQYGGFLVGDINASATIKFSDLDLTGSFKGSSGNGAFVAGRCRAGATIEIKNAIIDAREIASNAKNGILVGGGTQAITVKFENIYIKNGAGATLAGNNKDSNLTSTVTNCFYNATDAAEAAKFCTGTDAADSGFTSVTTAAATPAWLEETLGLDFEDVWMTEGDGLYRLRASSTNVKSADATLAKLTVSTGGAKLRYHKDDEFSTDGLVAFATYSDGVQLVVSGIQASGYDMTKVGAQEVTVSYTEGEITKTTTFDIMVAEQVGFEFLDEFVPKTYTVGSDLNVKDLRVYSVWSDDVREELATSGYTLDSSAYNKNAAGEYTISITNSTYDAQTFTVTVVDTKPVVVDNYVYVNVDGSQNGAYLYVDGVESFKTLNGAIKYLEACAFDASVNKVIYIAPGTYEEKIDTSLANLHLIGTSANYNDTVITYSAVESTVNPLTNSPYALQTVDCATVHVNGEGFEAANLSIRNDFDYLENTKTNAESSPQGLALTINGDGAVLYNVHLYGNQDTLYLKAGRAYLNKCLVEGNVDFIFGNDTGIALFDDCTINAVYRGETNNTGYVTAMKVSDGTKKPEFGYVFLGCRFTADENVRDGSMSLGRPWGKYATVAYINCNFSAAYSTAAYDGTTKSRWFDMSGNYPGDADFAEYGSQGDGSITEAVNGGKILTADQADRYTLANILAQQNGTLAKFAANVDFAAELTELKAEADGKTDTTAIYALDATGVDIVTTVAIQAEQDLSMFVKPWNSNNKLITVEVADPTIVSYENGVIKGLAGGTTTITLTQGTVQSTITVTVVDAAIWTVTFNTDGTEVAEQSVVDGYTIDATAITTTKEGAVFKGWYKDADFEEAFDVVNDTIKADTVLYARFANYADLALENFTMYLNGEEGDGINSFKAPEVEGEKNDINLQGKTEEAPGTVYALNVWGAKLQSRYDAASPNADCQFNASTYISFKVKAYATITITYRSNTSATLTMGEETLATLDSAATFTAQATKDGVVVLSQTAAGYISKIEVTYPTYIEETTKINFGSDGNYTTVEELNMTNANVGQIQNACCQIKGTVEFYVKKNATISISSYSGYTNYTLAVDGVTSEAQTGTSYSVTATTDTKVVMTATTSNNYIYSIQITYPQVITADTVLSNTATAGENSYVLTNDLDFTTTPFELTGSLNSHSSGAVQFKEGTAITFYVKSGAEVFVDGFGSNYGQFDIYANGTLLDITVDENQDYLFKVDADSKIEVKCKNVGTEEAPAYNQSYLYGITVTYKEETPVELKTYSVKVEDFTGTAVDGVTIDGFTFLDGENKNSIDSGTVKWGGNGSTTKCNVSIKLAAGTSTGNAATMAVQNGSTVQQLTFGADGATTTETCEITLTEETTVYIYRDGGKTVGMYWLTIEQTA